MARSVPAQLSVLGGAADAVYAQLMARAAGAGNDGAFAAMIATRSAGRGGLPPWLGLEPAAFRCLLEYHFPGLAEGALAMEQISPASEPSADLARGDGEHGGVSWGERADERDDVVRLLLMDKAGDSPSEVWMAHVVATGCMGGNHLWEDLGLMSRSQLTDLMRRNFPSLAARNVKDMKWKRFLYKQLCEAEGIYTCRAPSCEVCVDYHVCFGPAG